jgi:hypothetical protein
MDRCGSRNDEQGKGIDHRPGNKYPDRFYLPFPEDLSVFNQLWDAWIPRGFAPSRACIHTQLAAPGYRAELIITAACDAD